MRKLLKSLLIVANFVPLAYAVSGPVTLVNETGLSYSNTYPQNLMAYGSQNGVASKLSAQITFSSVTFANGTFTDGTQSTTSITVNSNTLLSAQATNTITVPSTSSILGAPATNQITMGTIGNIQASSPTITIFNGVQNLAYTWAGNWVSTDTAIHAATTLCNAINPNGASDLITCNASGGVVYASATVIGATANAFTISTSSANAVSLSSTSFLGGKTPALLNAYFSINGTNYRNGYHWTDVSGTSTSTALSIKNFINSVSTANAVCGGGLGSLVATQAGAVVTLTEQVGCLAGNNATLAVTPASGGLTVGSANFTGGADAASVSVNGRVYTVGVDFSTGAATSNTATSLASAINATSSTFKVASAAASNVVTATSTVSGTAANYVLTSSTDAALTLAGAKTVTAGASVGAMTGGTNAGASLATDIITIANHGFTKALPVLLSTGGATLGGLVNQTTYYVVVVDANSIGLSSTSAVAQAGRYIDITSSTTQTTAHTVTLAPLAFSQGLAAAKMQVSNDGTNYTDFSTTVYNVSIATQTFTPVNGGTTVNQDYGPVDFGYLRYNVVGPTAGAVQLKVILNAKD